MTIDEIKTAGYEVEGDDPYLITGWGVRLYARKSDLPSISLPDAIVRAEAERETVITEQQRAADATVSGTIRLKIEQALATLEQTYANWGALTAAQKDSALRLNARVTIALSRMVLGRFDSEGP